MERRLRAPFCFSGLAPDAVDADDRPEGSVFRLLSHIELNASAGLRPQLVG